MAGSRFDFFVVIATGMMAATLLYGYLVALIVGTMMAHQLSRLRTGLSV
jgi:hypothetical protein